MQKKGQFVIQWHIDDNLTCKLKSKDYDKLYSLEKFLQKRGIPEEEIKVIMSKKKPIWEAKNLYNNTKTDIRNYDMVNVYSNEAFRSQNWVIVWFIDDPKHIQTFENTAIYLAYKIAQLFDWDIRKKTQGNASMQRELMN